MTTPSVLREPERRIDGPEKVSGRAEFTADIHRDGELIAAFLGSPWPHARITRIDIARARAVTGVHAVLTGAAIGPVRMGRRLQDWPALAVERVRFIGEHVAAVAAETAEAAHEALALIEVDYEELPAILHPEAALAPDAPVLHPQADEYHYVGGTRPAVPHPNVQGHRVEQKGESDLEPIFARAPHVFEHSFTLSPLVAG